MNQKRTNKVYSQEFKKEALALISEQGYSVAEAALSLGLRQNILYRWKKEHDERQNGSAMSLDERSELIRLRKENKNLSMEKEILKKGGDLICEKNEVKCCFIKANAAYFPVSLLCRCLKISRSSYYFWATRLPKAKAV